MAEALYRKYRPQVFGDVVGQEHIERTIRNAIEHDKVSHAYLFTGPRGTGKTTTARLLAKALMCEKGPTPEPDGTCQDCVDIANGVHPDVYELDAASRTGVDNVREEIIGRVQFAPTRGRYKVYIIDEVHMLSTAAFNALLKTLEEPPSHVVFILCTTDPQKVPETIHSRCQRFDFHRISNDDIVARLGAVCGEEGVEFDPEALELIAYRAEGGMRNALTSLEQLIAFGGDKVSLDTAERMLGSMDSDELSDLVEALAARDAATCFNLTSDLVEDGTDLAQYVRDLAEYVRDLYLMSLVGSDVSLGITKERRAAMQGQVKKFGPDRLSNLLCVLGDLSKELRTSTNPRLSFEIALTRMVRPESDLTLSALAQRVEQLERALADGSFAAPTASAVAGGSAAPVAATGATTPASQAPARVSSVPQAQVAQREPRQASQSAPGVSSSPMPVTAQPGASVPLRGQAQSGPTPRQAAAPAQPRTARPADARPMAAPAPGPASSVSASASAPTATAPVSAPASTAAPAGVDVSNPANLQRLWRSVTTALRKENPARGVLFMNAKVSATDAGVVRVGFASENAFAFNAASKPEVVKLLAQTIEMVAGGSVPFELVMLDSAGAPSGMPRGGGAMASASPRPDAAAPSGQPAYAQENASRASSAVAEAQAAAARARAVMQSARAKASAPMQANASGRPQAVAQSQAGSYGADPMTASAPGPLQNASGTSAWGTPAAPSPARSQSPARVVQPSAQSAQVAAAPGGYDDDVPLDVYDSFASDYDDSGYEDRPPISPPGDQTYGHPAPAGASSRRQPDAASVPQRSQGAASAANGPVKAGAASAASPQAGVASVSSRAAAPQNQASGPIASADQPADAPGLEEMEQMFSDAFGSEIRFTDLD